MEKDINVKYIGEKSKFLKKDKIYKIKSVLKCPECGDEIVELYGFDLVISYCCFCSTPIFCNCFSASRFERCT